jgi:hypothetical protein
MEREEGGETGNNDEIIYPLPAKQFANIQKMFNMSRDSYLNARVRNDVIPSLTVPLYCATLLN